MEGRHTDIKEDGLCLGTIAHPSDGAVMASIFEHCHPLKDRRRSVYLSSSWCFLMDAAEPGRWDLAFSSAQKVLR